MADARAKQEPTICKNTLCRYSRHALVSKYNLLQYKPFKLDRKWAGRGFSWLTLSLNLDAHVTPIAFDAHLMSIWACVIFTQTFKHASCRDLSQFGAIVIAPWKVSINDMIYDKSYMVELFFTRKDHLVPFCSVYRDLSLNRDRKLPILSKVVSLSIKNMFLKSSFSLLGVSLSNAYFLFFDFLSPKFEQ